MRIICRMIGIRNSLCKLEPDLQAKGIKYTVSPSADCVVYDINLPAGLNGNFMAAHFRILCNQCKQMNAKRNEKILEKNIRSKGM